MARHFSLQTVLRMVPNRLLSEFFTRVLNQDLGIAWDGIGEREIEPILASLSDLNSAELNSVEIECHDIFDMASDTGMAAFIESASLDSINDLAQQLPAEGGHYEKAMWVWLSYPSVFKRAKLLHHVENLSWWRKRDDLPQRAPRTTPKAIQRFERALSEVLLRHEGRGLACTVDTLSRGEAVYFLAYPDDYVQNFTAHDEDGKLSPRKIRPTFSIAFAFNPTEGTLELSARLPAKVKPLLEQVFANEILKYDLGPWHKSAAYQLNHLLERGFPLTTDPEDGVTACIRRMRLSRKNSRRRIILEADPELGPHDIYDMIESDLNRRRITKLSVNVTQVTLAFEFEPVDGRKPGSMSFDVSYPDSCSLRNQRPERLEMALKYLKRWNIDVTKSPAARS